MSELAKLSGVSVASISKYVKKNRLKPVKTGENNSKYFDSAVYNKVLTHYRTKVKTEGKSQNNKDLVIEAQRETIDQLKDTVKTLKEQITILNTQLEVKDKQIATANQLADQAQHLDLTTHTQQKLPDAPNATNISTEKKHGFWWNLTH